jgi:hypothetical protein
METVMPPEFQCFDDPTAILERALCVSALSKDLKGELILSRSMGQKCMDPECKTLKTVHSLRVKLEATRCDSPLAKALDGSLSAKLITAFDTDGMHRGFHSGDFTWTGSSGVKVTGRMSGVTNVGSHRLPIKSCQKCSDLGIMEGRLCGQVIQARESKLKGCQVIADYRIKFDPSIKGGVGSVVGTIEGVIVCFCT